MTTTFRDFTFRASHSLRMKFGAASHPHSHTYAIRFYVEGVPDQDALDEEIRRRYSHFHNCGLNALILPESTDEALAEWFLKDMAEHKCVRVTVTNDGQRGAEAYL